MENKLDGAHLISNSYELEKLLKKIAYEMAIEHLRKHDIQDKEILAKLPVFRQTFLQFLVIKYNLPFPPFKFEKGSKSPFKQ